MFRVVDCKSSFLLGCPSRKFRTAHGGSHTSNRIEESRPLFGFSAAYRIDRSTTSPSLVKRLAGYQSDWSAHNDTQGAESAPGS
jgi:hypothetical protein